MDKNAIKTFAVESRRKMIKSVKFQASLLGITADEIKEPISKAEGMETYDYGAGHHTIYDEDIKKRESLVREINNKGFENVVEEVAYTWFNRIIAIRYMEVNDYLPTYTRVLSSEIEGKIEPDIITEALDLDLDYSDEDREKILKFKMDNDNDKLFQFLFIKQCNKLNEILPGLFEKTDDYMELLLDIKFTDEDSVVRQLVDTISEEDFKEQVEIIGWIYQFYNIELKDETFANLKKKIKISKERIPAATQLFTPDWIVKYMVENSVGRLWLEGHPNDELKSKWKYYVEESDQEPEVELKLAEIRKESTELKPEDIKVIDPCMGSGHILVYVFDVLMQIYVSEGFTEKDAVESILKNNIYGLDIDDRAYQLAYFAVLMKARSFQSKIFKLGSNPKLFSILESNIISKNIMDLIFPKNDSIKSDLLYLVEKFKDSKEYGSLLDIKKLDFDKLLEALISIKNSKQNNLTLIQFKYEFDLLINLVTQAKILSQKYSVVITNPPYMGKNSMTKELSNFLKIHFPSTKLDLYAVFIEKCQEFVEENGFCAMITQHSFMFLSTYESLREKIINETTIINLLHLGPRAFDEIGGEVVQTASFIYKNCSINQYKSKYYDLVNFNSENSKRESFLENISEIQFEFNQNDFCEIPGKTFAYWATNRTLECFKIGDDITKYIDSFQGIITGKNTKFLRYWHELSTDHIVFDANDMDEVDLNKTYWIPYNKGGKFRKWYGNQDYVVFWKYGPSDKTRGKASFSDYYLREYVSWSYIASTTLSTRFYPSGFLWDVNGSGMFDKGNNLKYIQALLTSKVGIYFLKGINPTLSFQVENILQVPIIFDKQRKNQIDSLVDENIEISKQDWDSFEISWNFNKHPFLCYGNNLIEENFNFWKSDQKNKINQVLKNETCLNELLIKIYGLEDELNSNLSISDITLYCPNYEKDIKSFISYAIGCMFGRYSLDDEGLQYAGGKFDINRYSRFIPDEDNIIPVLDTEYFEDDIVSRFVEFVKTCFGEETLEENLDYIAKALSGSNKSSREIIREYLLKNFFNDHNNIYHLCPIYWQFSSGRYNGFNCLVYMHRYEPSLVARIRTDYLHKTQKKIEQNLAQCESIIANSSNKSEVSKATKDKSKYIKQLDEIKVYDEALAHIANQRIEIDLDDGVKVNHAKFQNVEISKEGQKSKKINLLKKI